MLNENIVGNTSPADNGSLNYTLDAVGNRLSLTSTLAALQSQTKTYDSNDRTSGDTFDSNGNTLTSGGVNYTYDFEDRLISTSTGVQIAYDGDGNRVSETAGGVTTKFLVDDLTPTGYAQVSEEVVNGVVTAQYTYGLMRISQSRSSVSYYGYDGTASVRQLFDSTGAVTDTYAYDAFGNTVARTGTTVNPYQYRGEQFDASLAMYYLRARYYIPQTGRFLTQDTYEGDDEDPLTLHKYLYANADPTNGIDPSGFANTVENSLATQFGNIIRQVFSVFNTGMRGLTLGRVRAGAKLAYDTICCLDKAWSVLGLAIGFIAAVDPSPENLQAATYTLTALSLIDAVCRLGCGDPTPLLSMAGGAGAGLGGGSGSGGSGSGGGGTPTGPTPNPSLPRLPERGNWEPGGAWGNGALSPDPHTALGTGGQGKPYGPYVQGREFGPNGRPIRDIHFTDHGRPDHPNPHQHIRNPCTGKWGGPTPFIF